MSDETNITISCNYLNEIENKNSVLILIVTLLSLIVVILVVLIIWCRKKKKRKDLKKQIKQNKDKIKNRNRLEIAENIKIVEHTDPVIVNKRNNNDQYLHSVANNQSLRDFSQSLSECNDNFVKYQETINSPLQIRKSILVRRNSKDSEVITIKKKKVQFKSIKLSKNKKLTLPPKYQNKVHI